MPTKISWTRGDDGSPGATWNPLRARNPETSAVGWSCIKVSEGCAHCYAEEINRTARWGGTGLSYTVGDNARVEHFLDEKTLAQPLHWRKPRRIFVCSMTDLFGEWVPDEQIDRILAVMALTPQHTYQVLSKRPQRMRSYLRPRIEQAVLGGGRRVIVEDVFWAEGPAIGRIVSAMNASGVPLAFPLIPQWPLPNVWLGVSAEDQQRADERIPVLLDTPAAVRFVSIEPQLEAIRISGWLDRDGIAPAILDWVIVGAESGPHRRPFDVAWAASIYEQCKAAGVAYWGKQGSGRHSGVELPAPYDLKEFPQTALAAYDAAHEEAQGG